MKAKKIEPAAGFDTPTHLTSELCDSFLSSGFNFVMRYVPRWRAVHDEPEPDIGTWFYGLSRSERDVILGSGLALGIVQAAKLSTELSEENGHKTGLVAVKNCQDLEMPAGVTVFCDAEFNEASADAVIAYLNGWSAAVEPHYRCGLYIGFSGLSGEQYYSLPRYRCYWRSAMKYIDSPHPRGFAMIQTRQQDLHGIDVDLNSCTYDSKRDRVWFAVGD